MKLKQAVRYWGNPYQVELRNAGSLLRELWLALGGLMISLLVLGLATLFMPLLFTLTLLFGENDGGVAGPFGKPKASGKGDDNAQD